MPCFKKLWRKPKTQKNLVSYSGSASPANPPVSESSTNTASNGQKTVIVPTTDTQQTTRAPPQSIAQDPTEKQGLRPIYIPISASDDDDDRVGNSLDIVAVHGITGNAYDTWTHGNGTFWLRDLIPKDLPDVRVFSYGYPADVFCTFATGTIDTFARSLLESLKRERRNSNKSGRSYSYVIAWEELWLRRHSSLQKLRMNSMKVSEHL
ncbi:hypothetical protein B0J14DRAFT_157364 [Halenospora varia]|nr:hypothetical protein B0J14DRAFT_157364 [Halenospora varia]